MASAAAPPAERFTSFSAFYPFYKQQHCRLGTRLLHLAGTSLFLANTALCLATRRHTRQLLLGPVAAYSCAWVGHFFVELNRPATFSYPVWSLMGDFVMFFNVLRGKEPLVLPESDHGKDDGGQQQQAPAAAAAAKRA